MAALLGTAAPVALAAPGHASHATAAKRVVRIVGRVRDGRRATFRLAKLRHVTVLSATVVRGRHRHRVSPKAVRRGARKGSLTIALPKPLVIGVGGPAQSAPGTSLVVTVPGVPVAGAPASTPGGAVSADPGASAPAPAPQPPVLVVTVDPATTTPAGTPDTTTSTATTTATTTTTGTTSSGDVAPGPESTLLAPHARILSDAEAASHVRRSPFEPRPLNGTANATTPTADQLDAYRASAANFGACNSYHQHVTGDFTGTTDEIIQWAAWKWGLDEDVFRADAAVETWWRQGFVGDSGLSFGLMQVKKTVHTGTYPMSQDSTAFNVDYYAATIRWYYDGCATWLNSVDHGQPYAAGDLWGALGAWYAGRWHTAAADGYIAKVKDDLAKRVWTLGSF